MHPERWQNCTDIFNLVVEQPPDERVAFLERSCDGDEALRRKVELLLKYHDTSGDFIKSPAFKVAPELLAGDPEALIGQHLGCYRVDAIAGVGGMGVVYVAWDERLDRKVALKLLPQSMVENEAELGRLKREARTASALNHPNIVTIHEIGEADSIHYVATEFIEGITLRERMTKGAIPPNEAVDIAAQVASALCVAHRVGIVHRDIKPENIMLRPDGYVKVLDFGIAKITQQESLGTTKVLRAQLATQRSMVLGTTRYMSPEQAMAQQVDARSDLWSLGVVLYEMLAGRAPFEGDTATDVIAAIFDRDPQPLKDSAPIVPRALRSVVNRSLRKDPAERYQTGEEMLSELRAIKEKGDGIAARNARWIGVAAVAAMLVGLALFYASRGGRTAPAPAAAVTEKSIAVLPLQNLSEDKENAFFADGVQDELLSNLSKIKDLKVISRTSVMQYKSGTRRNLKEIAQQLGVSNVVEGSVRRSGDHIRMSVQLIDARTDRHLWGENYDRNLADSLSLQGELATEIASAVGATLSPQEKARVVAKPTNNPAAYDAYLRARAIPFDWGFALEGDIASAIHLYEQAVRLDPNFTLAWAYLSIAQIQSASKGIDSGPALRARAKDSLNHALALDPNLPEVHLARGYNEPFTGAVGLEDDTRALAEFRQAEQGLPNSVDVIEAIARMQRGLGHWDEAVADLRRGIELDPRNISTSNNLALTYCAMRRFPEALATLDRVLAWDPTNARALLTKADALMAIGDLQAAEPLLANPELPAERRARYALFQRNYAAAIEILSKDLAVDRQQRDPGDILSLAFSQQLAGDIAAARGTYQKAIESSRGELEKGSPGSYVEAYTRIHLGAAYAGLGEAASAIAEGQKAMALVPASKDPEFGPDLEWNMAHIYAQLGDADHAIPMLKRLLRTPHPAATFLTPATLRLDPIWDPIRNDPRFQELTLEELPVSEKSIAVLPFENLSKDEENAFFAAGVQDEILTDLAKVADLKVISRTSVMQYKSGLERNLREIAKTLGVSHVVEGSVQRAGDRVRVSAQLIDARNDTHLWAEHYDRHFADIFAIQSEIAERIADQLRAKLSAAEKAAIAERPTADLVAYAYYTKAKDIDWRENWEGREKSLIQKVELLEKAIQRDPNFALAYCELAKTHVDFGYTGIGDAESRKHLELAKKAAEAALRVRPDLGEAHLELASYYFYAFDYDRARDELNIVRRKLPNNAEALMIEALIGRHENRWDVSLANLQKASELDPRNSDVHFQLARVYFEMRRYSECEQFMTKETATSKVEDIRIKWWLAEIKLAQGDPVAAQSLLEQVPLDYSPGDWVWGTRFTAALYLRDYDAANRVIAAIPAKWAETAFSAAGASDWARAQIARARGDKEKAFAAFAAARTKLEAKSPDTPEDAEYLSEIAKFDAGLGRKEEAIRAARRAVDLMPTARDAVAGPTHVVALALVYAWTGERDRALEQLEKVATVPGVLGGPVPTYGDLRFNPCWDDLRGDPRFDKIVAAAKAASK
jgi:eukaryotic-like serine/threonine-protein kinase